MSEFKVGDKFVVVDGPNIFHHCFAVGGVVEFASPYFDRGYSVKGLNSVGDTVTQVVTKDDIKLLSKPTNKTKIKSTGGPSQFYDLPFKDWTTVNDQMEYLAEHKWGKYSIHLKDIFKGLCRWNDKEGTTIEYDTNKIIYYGVRVLRMLKGNKGVQEYLTKLLNDPQFKE